MTFQIAARLENRCRQCSFCESHISCPGIRECVGCGTCVDACPNTAKVLQKVSQERPIIKVLVDGQAFEIPSRITILRALELLGYEASRLPGGSDIFAPCRTGGCWACAVVVDGELKPSCMTPARDGVAIQTRKGTIEGFPALRRISGFQGHTVGGVGTPYWLKRDGPSEADFGSRRASMRHMPDRKRTHRTEKDRVAATALDGY